MPFSRTLVAVLAAACLTLVSSGTRADEVDDLAKKLDAVVGKQKTLQFKSVTTTEMSMGEMSSKSTSDATYAYMMKDDRVLFRVETKTKGTNKMGGVEQKTDSTSLMISDGEFSYSYTEMQGMKYAMKSKADNNQNPFSMADTWKEMRKTNTIKVLPDEKVGGYDCYVVEMTPTDPNLKGHVGRTVTHYDKKTGVGIKTVVYDGQGKAATTSTVSDVKINENIDPALFVFKAPEGVVVQDNTKLQP